MRRWSKMPYSWKTTIILFGYSTDRVMPAPKFGAGDQFERPDWQVSHVISKRLLNAAERAMPLDRLAALYPFA